MIKKEDTLFEKESQKMERLIKKLFDPTLL